MLKIIVDGLYLTEKLTGVQRFACEVVGRLAEREDLSLCIVLPEKAEIINKVPSDVEVVRYGRLSGRFWEQICLPAFCKKHKLPLLCTGNIAPVFYKNTFLVLHDVIFCEDDVYSNRLWKLKSRILTRMVIYRARRVFTVSNFAKSRITHFYKRLKSEPGVLCAGWEHVCSLGSERPQGLPGQFFLTVGSKNPNKNFDYIIKLARDNPEKNFVVTGLGTQAFAGGEIPKNCFFAGYVGDNQLKWLYSHCEGYIFPTLYEGFGLPPLEAVACGCTKLYLSDIPPLREIYEGCAVFFDPADYEHTVDLTAAKYIAEEQAEELLKKYSWQQAASSLYAYLQQDLADSGAE